MSPGRKGARQLGSCSGSLTPGKGKTMRGRGSERERQVPHPLPGFGTKTVRCSLGPGRKEVETTSMEVGYFIQARRGDSRPNDQAEHREGSGRLHI